jgi:hypothetical protein
MTDLSGDLLGARVDIFAGTGGATGVVVGAAEASCTGEIDGASDSALVGLGDGGRVMTIVGSGENVIAGLCVVELTGDMVGRVVTVLLTGLGATGAIVSAEIGNGDTGLVGDVSPVLEIKQDVASKSMHVG